MLDPYALEALATVVQERSFSKAAQILFITQSAISQRIKALETVVGRPLLIRTPVVKPTKAGEQLIAHYKNLLLLDQNLQNTISHTKNKAAFFPLVMAVNTESLATWFVDAIAPTLKKYPILLELLIEDQDRTIDFLKDGKVWGCVTSVKEPPAGCSSHPLGKMNYRLVCTPEFQKKYFADGITGRTLLKAPAVIWGQHDYMHRNFLCSIFKDYKKGRPRLHYVPAPQGIFEFALQGIAFALLPEYFVQRPVQRGTLIDLLPSKPYELPLYFQTQELQTDVTKEFCKQIVGYAEKNL